VPIDHTASIRRKPKRLASINTRRSLRGSFACVQAYLATGKGRWRKEAWTAFNWFLGDNDLQIALTIPAPVDAATGCIRTAPMRTGSGIDIVFFDGALEMRKLEQGKENNS